MSIASELTAAQTNLQNAKDAVTAKGGAVGDTGLAGLASEIATIPSGGGGAPDPTKLIRFFDYDGTLLYSYTQAEAQDLTEMPAHPTHDGLVADGWTHTLQEVKSHIYLDVGAVYYSGIGSADTTYLKLWLNTSTLAVRFQQDVSDGVTIDWGDGSVTETVSGTGQVSASHTYTISAKTLPVVLKLTPASGVTLILGHGTSSSSGYFLNPYPLSFEAVIGRAQIAQRAFYSANGLQTIVISRAASWANSSNSVFYTNTSLKALISPVTMSNQGGGNVGTGLESLKTLIIPSYTSTNFPYFISTGVGLGKWVVVEGGATLFNQVARAFPTIRFTDGLTNDTTLDITSPALVYDFREITFVKNNISGTLAPQTLVVVPDSLYASWIADSAWSAYSSQIVKASDYEAGGGI